MASRYPKDRAPAHLMQHRMEELALLEKLLKEAEQRSELA